MAKTVLVLNSGSSSIKFQLFQIDAQSTLERLIKGQFDGIGSKPRLAAKGKQGEALIEETWEAGEIAGVPDALHRVVDFLRGQMGGELPSAIGHRVVHGGIHYTRPTVVTGELIEKLEPLVPLAPLHQPNNLLPIKIIQERLPHLLQVACFDTAFHRGHPELADRFAIPEDLYQEGVRRYGFHGLSYEYVSQRLAAVAPEIAAGKVVIAHLGSGASMCAVFQGASVDSTMGFTALDGLPMGTRPGQLDAGVILYLMQQKGMSAKEIERLLYNECGLKGLSGLSNDVRNLLATDDPRAKFALDYFVYRIALHAGSLAAAMGGIDGFVFTAGIGENAPEIRAAVMKRLSWLGFELNTEANAMGGPLISSAGSKPALVVATNEELLIAQHTLECM